MSGKVKFLFLDVDGVLNGYGTTNETTPTGFTFVEDRLVEKLKKILDATEAKVVLSSDWRFEHPRFTQEAMGEDLRLLLEKLAEFRIELYGITSRSYPHRGWEIDNWLEDQSWKYGGLDNISFVILDDLPAYEFMGFEDHLVHTDEYYGLTDEDVEKAIKILNEVE